MSGSMHYPAVSYLRLLAVHFVTMLVTVVQDHFARIMAAYEDRRLSVWLEVAEQFGVTKAAAARLTST